jgi:thiamine-phosphate pyrophosphorylase
MILITEPQFFPEEIKLINALFANGLTCLHLRKPEASAEQIALLLKRIEPEYHKSIMLHSHYHLAEKFNLRGIHFTEKTKKSYKLFSQWPVAKSMAVHELFE